MVWKLKLFLLFILQHFTLESVKQLAFETTKVDANHKKWRREESQRDRDSRKMRGPFPPGPHLSSPGQLGSMAIPRFTLSCLSKQNKENSPFLPNDKDRFLSENGSPLHRPRGSVSPIDDESTLRQVRRI